MQCINSDVIELHVLMKTVFSCTRCTETKFGCVWCPLDGSCVNNASMCSNSQDISVSVDILSHQGSLWLITSVLFLLYPWHIPLESYSFNRVSMVGLQSCDIILCVIPATRCSCYMQCLGREWVIILGFPPVYPCSH